MTLTEVLDLFATDIAILQNTEPQRLTPRDWANTRVAREFASHLMSAEESRADIALRDAVIELGKRIDACDGYVQRPDRANLLRLTAERVAIDDLTKRFSSLVQMHDKLRNAMGNP